MSFSFGAPRPTRRPSLTPMIDVVFLLLIFFMLAARFGVEETLPLAPAGASGEAYTGPPRLVTIAPAELRLNGVPVPPEALAGELGGLMAGPGELVVLRPVEGAELGRLAEVLALLRGAGITRLVVVE